MSALRKTIKSKIAETSVNKKRLINEQSIINERLNVILENNPLKTRRQVKKLANDFLYEVSYLNSRGYDKLLLEAGFFDFFGNLFKSGPAGIGQYFWEQVAKYLLDKMGMKDGFLKEAIIVWFGETPFTEMSKMFTDCRYFVRSLGKTVVETYVKRLADQKLGGGAFYDIFRNALMKAIEAGTLDDVIYGTLEQVICPLLNGMLPKFENIQNAMRSGAYKAATT
jgi:hypothetical protein